MVFFLAGFNAVSGAECFMAHELAVNPDIQMKLYNEIDDVDKKLDGKTITYEVLQKMTYMDMVVSETLRRWTLAPANDRRVNRAYVLEGNNGQKLQLNVGDGIWIPTVGLHMDQNYFPNPNKFDPERFSDENKHTIRSGTYLPFGIGPRNCVRHSYRIFCSILNGLIFRLVRDLL